MAVHGDVGGQRDIGARARDLQAVAALVELPTPVAGVEEREIGDLDVSATVFVSPGVSATLVKPSRRLSGRCADAGASGVVA